MAYMSGNWLRYTFKNKICPYMKRCIVLLAGILLSFSLLAQEPYLRADDLPDAVKFLPPPPEDGSPAFRYDEARYLWGKSQRTGERGQQAVQEATTNVDTMALLFSKAFGRELSEKTTPRTMQLLKRSVKTLRLAAAKPKATYMRLRPFVFYREATLIPGHEHFQRTTGSYPSGHTVRGWGMALILAELCPERQDSILIAGYEWGQSRVIAGYHWQSDVDASRLLSSATVARLHANSEFLQDLEAARAELAGNKSR